MNDAHADTDAGGASEPATVAEEPAWSAPPPSPGRPAALGSGRLVVGLVLVAVGAIWLLQSLDVVDVSLLVVFAGVLILIGLVLLSGARTRRHGGLIALGIVLTVILTVASSFDIRLQGGVGERTVRPTGASQLEREYHLSMGQLTIDLRDVELLGSVTKIRASVGMGQLVVRVPESVAVRLHATAGAGNITAFGQDRSGLDAELNLQEVPTGGASPGGAATVELQLDLSVGLGQIEVSS